MDRLKLLLTALILACGGTAWGQTPAQKKAEILKQQKEHAAMQSMIAQTNKSFADAQAEVASAGEAARKAKQIQQVLNAGKKLSPFVNAAKWGVAVGRAASDAITSASLGKPTTLLGHLSTVSQQLEKSRVDAVAPYQKRLDAAAAALAKLGAKP